MTDNNKDEIAAIGLFLVDQGESWRINEGAELVGAWQAFVDATEAQRDAERNLLDLARKCNM